VCGFDERAIGIEPFEDDNFSFVVMEREGLPVKVGECEIGNGLADFYFGRFISRGASWRGGDGGDDDEEGEEQVFAWDLNDVGKPFN